MDSRYIKVNVLPIIVEILFVIACLIFKDFVIYINFCFYMILAMYFCRRKDFSITKCWNYIKGGSTFWKQVILTMFFFILAFIFTNILENMLPHLNAGMIKLRADNYLKLSLFTVSTIILAPIAEELFYRKNALEHTFTIWGIFLCMIWALPLSCSYIKTKNIYVTITAHFICNMLVNGITIIKVWDYLHS